jgi:hypothetical protein
MSRYDEGSGHSRASIRGLFLSIFPRVNLTIEALDVMTDYVLGFAWNAPSLRGSCNTTVYEIRMASADLVPSSPPRE